MRFRNWDRNLKVRLAGEFCVNSIFWMFFPFLILSFNEEFGKQTTGILIVVSQLLSVMASLLGGYFSDHFGRKRMMLISATMQAITMGFFALSTSPWFDLPWLAFICFSILGICNSLYSPASQAMVADVVTDEDRVSVFAVFYTVMNISVVFGPLVGSFFFNNYRFELYIAAGIVMGIVTIVLSRLLVETAPSIVNGERSRPVQGWMNAVARQLKSYYLILTDKVFFLFIFAGVLLSIAYLQLEILVPVFIDELMDGTMVLSLPSVNLFGTFLPETIELSSQNVVGIMLAENGMMVILLTMFITMIVNRNKERNVFIVGSLFYAFSMLILAITTGIIGILVAIFIFTLAEIMTAGIQNNFVARIAPADLRGQYFAASGLRWTLGRTIAPLAINLAAVFSFQTAFILVGLLACISAVLYAAVYRAANDRIGSVTAK